MNGGSSAPEGPPHGELQMSRLRRILSIGVALAVAAAMIVPSTAFSATSRVRLVPILSGYQSPLLVTNDGRPGRVIYIVERDGRILRATFANGRWRKLGTFLDIRDRVVTDPNAPVKGLLGLAFHPGYGRNGRFYVWYTRVGAGEDAGDIVLAEYRRRTAARARRSSERIVMVLPNDEAIRANHYGGQLSFGPDGLLYIAIGDNGGRDDPSGNGQDRSTLWGSLLRIDPLDPDGPGPRRYRIPRGNPFVGRFGRNEIWAYGLRNPWRTSFDRRTGDLWIADVGQGLREEVDKAEARRSGRNAGRAMNFGWADCEGTLEHNLDESDADDQCSSHVLPAFDYALERDNGKCAVIGGHVHRGPAQPRWRGLYVAGDFCGQLFVLDQRGKLRWTANSGRSLSSFGEDAAGRIFATDFSEGTIFLVRFVGPRPRG